MLGLLWTFGYISATWADSRNKVEEFDINIIRINKESDTKNILFEITDKELLEATGGIVQGMSGSPIIQNGMLVGAVSHVTIENPTIGYGMYAKWMLEDLCN